MNHHQRNDAVTSRRTFLKTSCAAAILCHQQTSGYAADAIERNGKPYFKLSLAAYSFRNSLTRGWPAPSGKEGSMSLFDVIDFCADQDLDGVELTSYYFPNPLTPEFIRDIQERAFRLGLAISGTAIGNDFCLPEGPARAAQLQLCRDWIDFSAEMGAPVIRIFAGKVSRGQTEEQALDLCVAGIEESLQYAANKGVVLALENHGGITATSDQLLEIVSRVQPSKWFGVNFDSGNFHTPDPYEDLAKIAPYAVNAQIKVMITPQGQLAQPTDYERVLSILRAANYRGYVVLEYEEPEDPMIAVPKHLQQLRKLLSVT